MAARSPADSSKATSTPGSLTELHRAANQELHPSRVLAHPAAPTTRVGRPRGRPPPSDLVRTASPGGSLRQRGPEPNRGRSPCRAGVPHQDRWTRFGHDNVALLQSEFALGDIDITLSDHPFRWAGKCRRRTPPASPAPPVGGTQSGRPPYWRSLCPGDQAAVDPFQVVTTCASRPPPQSSSSAWLNPSSRRSGPCRSWETLQTNPSGSSLAGFQVPVRSSIHRSSRGGGWSAGSRCPIPGRGPAGSRRGPIRGGEVAGEVGADVEDDVAFLAPLDRENASPPT